MWGGSGAGGTAALQMSVSGLSFSGNSVRIVGNRSVDADSKYPCLNEIDTCLNFDVDGKVEDVSGLCPSENVPNGDWTFDYTVFSDIDCGGVVINDLNNPNNFVCYDSQDLFTRAHPNQTVNETLHRGGNQNFIECLTQNASKSFDFNACTIVEDSKATSVDPATLELDCGCTPASTPNACDCTQDMSNLEAGCEFDPLTCNIVCQASNPPACDAGDTSVAYNALPFDVENCRNPSRAFEATQTNEFGDAVQLAGAGTIQTLNVVMSSWACESGYWDARAPFGPCVTSPGKTYPQEIIATLYTVDETSPGCSATTPCVVMPYLAQVTETKNIPYRPSANSTSCADPHQWFNAVTGLCENGFSSVQSFDFSGKNISISSGDKVIWTVAFNTSHYGYSPIGTATSCYTASGGCFYDSLNVGAKSHVNAPYSGVDLDSDVVYLSTTPASPPSSPGPLAPVTGWTGYRPLGEIITQ